MGISFSLLLHQGARTVSDAFIGVGESGFLNIACKNSQPP